MNATREGSGVRVNLGINPRVVADLFRDWTNACEQADRANRRMSGEAKRWEDLAASYARDLHELLNPRLTVGQARAFGWETVNAAMTAAREAMNEEGVAG